MPTLPTRPGSALVKRRQALLHLKSLFWCLHQLSRQYNLNLVQHSIERGSLHPDLDGSNLGDNIQYLLDTFDEHDRRHILDALRHQAHSRAAMDVAEKHFEIGHYVQAETSFGPIAEGSYGIICAITPQLRGLFYLDGDSLMTSAFAPSDVRVIFGTYVS